MVIWAWLKLVTSPLWKQNEESWKGSHTHIEKKNCELHKNIRGTQNSNK